MNSEELFEVLSGFSSVQAGELKSRLEDHWGIKAEPISLAGVAEVPTTEAKVEQTEFSLFVVSAANKVGVIKVVREMTGLGLMECKKLIDSINETSPAEIKTGLTKDEAEEMKRKIDAGGGSAVVK